MAIDRADLQAVDKTDIQVLIDGGVQEGLRVEYKLQLWGSSDADKKEYLKDVSALSNRDGGHIIIGIKEEKGIPVELVGISNEGLDSKLQSLENLASSCIEPRIFGLQFQVVEIDDDSVAIIIRIPKSWNFPHRASFKNTKRFYLRNSNGVHEASVDELRNMFNLSGTLYDKIRDFRDRRINLIHCGKSPRLLEDGGKLVVHILPYSAFMSTKTIDLESLNRGVLPFVPLRLSSGDSTFNFDGFLFYSGAIDKPSSGYAQVFRNGIVELVDTYYIGKGKNGVSGIYAQNLEGDLLNKLPNYLMELEKFGVDGPYVILIALCDVKGSIYYVGDHLLDHQCKRIDRTDLIAPECIIEKSDDDVFHDILKPVFDSFWNAGGFAKCYFYDSDRHWTGKWQD